MIPIKSNYSKNSTTTTGIITKFEIDGNLCTIHLKSKEKLIIYYYFDTESEKIKYHNELKLGITLEVKGVFNKPTKNTIPNGFNYQAYLRRNQIYYLVQAESIKITKNNTSVFYAIKNYLLKRIDKIDNTGYLRTFLLGDKSKMNEQTLKSCQSNGISHLFSISGMHVSLIVGVILYFINKISYQALYKYSIIIPILIFYLFLTDCSASILRTVIMFILFALNQCFNLKIKKLDIMLLVLIIAILINPYIIFDIGFQFSYSISLTIIITNKKINQSKNSILKNLYLSFICFIVSFPICVYYFYQVNFLSIVFNLIMIPIVSIIIFPLTWITMLIPIIYPLYEKLIIVLEWLNNFLNQLDILKITFVKPSIIIIGIYYLVIVLSFRKKQYYIILFTIILIHRLYPYWNSNFIFTTIDVGQGDSLFIKLPFNEGNILIDTGGKVTTPKEKWQQRENESSIVIDKTIPYLKSSGINELDYLILTHGDYDHMGEIINLVENFKVEKVILNCGPYNDLEQELIKVLDKKHIKYYSCIKELNIDKNKLYFLQTKEYDNENDNSNVIFTELNGYKFMFMGDASTITEHEILNEYNIPNIDVLKVGHHGSKTSSSIEFINEIIPKYSIISVGKNNRYGHPNKEVLENLENSEIYRTDEDGSIMFKIKNNKLKIETCSP